MRGYPVDAKLLARGAERVVYTLARQVLGAISCAGKKIIGFVGFPLVDGRPTRPPRGEFFPKLRVHRYGARLHLLLGDRFGYDDVRGSDILPAQRERLVAARCRIPTGRHRCLHDGAQLRRNRVELFGAQGGRLSRSVGFWHAVLCRKWQSSICSLTQKSKWVGSRMRRQKAFPNARQPIEILGRSVT